MNDSDPDTLSIVCPTCKKAMQVPANWRPRPFCSQRCKLIDLGRWLDEDYTISRPASFDDIDG